MHRVPGEPRPLTHAEALPPAPVNLCSWSQFKMRPSGGPDPAAGIALRGGTDAHRGDSRATRGGGWRDPPPSHGWGWPAPPAAREGPGAACPADAQTRTRSLPNRERITRLAAQPREAHTVRCPKKTQSRERKSAGTAARGGNGGKGGCVAGRPCADCGGGICQNSQNRARPQKWVRANLYTI